jgi:hypothetical protein
MTRRNEMRKSGTVAGFCRCDTGYLKLIIDDLGLDAKPESLAYLQRLYLEANFEPTVSDLYFDTAVMEASLRRPEAVRVAAVRSRDASVAELWGGLVRRLPSDAAAGSPVPSLVRCAWYAATGGDGTGASASDVSASLTFGDMPSLPVPGRGVPSVFCSNGLYLTLYPSVRFGCVPQRSAGLLLSPGSQCSFDEYVRRVSRLVSYVDDKYLTSRFVPLGGRGLIFDLSDSLSAAAVNCSELPGSPEAPECVTGSFGPAGVLVLPLQAAADASSAASCEGLACSPGVSAIEGDSFFIRAREGNVTKTGAFLRRLKVVRPLEMEADTGAALSGTGECRVFSSTSADVRAFSLDGPPYAALREACGRHWAVGGTLSPDDPAVIPFILAMDAYRRNSGSAASAASFRTGSRTSVTVFSFSD